MSFDDIINHNEYNHKIKGSGSYGILFDNEDGTLTKVIRYDTIDTEPFIKIKSLNLDNFNKILDVLIRYKGEISYIKAYKVEEIKLDDTILIKAPIDFFIGNMKILMNSLKILSDNYIMTRDLYEDNLIVNKDGITVIDFDLYKKVTNYPTELIYEHNINELKVAIYHLLKDELKRVSHFSFIKRKRLYRLFKDNDLDTIINELNGKETIYQYLKK